MLPATVLALRTEPACVLGGGLTRDGRDADKRWCDACPSARPVDGVWMGTSASLCWLHLEDQAPLVPRRVLPATVLTLRTGPACVPFGGLTRGGPLQAHPCPVGFDAIQLNYLSSKPQFGNGRTASLPL